MEKCPSNCCNHNHEENKKIYLTLEDNSQLECNVLDLFEVNNKEYIAVLPVES